jgi:hypothetical protein
MAEIHREWWIPANVAGMGRRAVLQDIYYQ